MPGLFRQGGINFDDLFDPDVVGDGPTTPNLRAGGTPLKYAGLSYGTKRADVGYRAGGSDVSNLWAAKGPAQYGNPGLNGKALYAGDQALTNQPTMSANAGVNFSPDGTWAVSGGNSRGAVAQPAPTSGTWLPSGQSASDYEIQYVITATGGANVNNGAPTYADLTSARAASLQIPTQPANNANNVTGNATVQVRVRRKSTGSVNVANFTIQVTVNGWL